MIRNSVVKKNFLCLKFLIPKILKTNELFQNFLIHTKTEKILNLLHKNKTNSCWYNKYNIAMGSDSIWEQFLHSFTSLFSFHPLWRRCSWLLTATQKAGSSTGLLVCKLESAWVTSWLQPSIWVLSAMNTLLLLPTYSC